MAVDREARVAWRDALLDADVRECWRRAYDDAPPTPGGTGRPGVDRRARRRAPAGEPMLLVA
jgi:hypothetical protein